MKLADILLSICLCFFGAFVIFLGLRLMLGLDALKVGGIGCRAMCGLGLLLSEFFGQRIAGIAAGLFWLVVGLCLLYFGYKIIRKNSALVGK